jgi:hypothetical protein
MTLSPASSVPAVRSVATSYLIRPRLSGIKTALFLPAYTGAEASYSSFPEQRPDRGMLLANSVVLGARPTIAELASLDQSDHCYTGFWGTNQTDWRLIGNFDIRQAAAFESEGPRQSEYNPRPMLLPTVKNCIKRIQNRLEKGSAMRANVLVFTLMALPYDMDEFARYCREELHGSILGTNRPMINIVLVGVGSQISLEQLARLQRNCAPNYGDHPIKIAHASTWLRVPEAVSGVLHTTALYSPYGYSVLDAENQTPYKVHPGSTPIIPMAEVPMNNNGLELLISGDRLLISVP